MTTKLNQTPKSLGYRMPAEWEPQVGTWFTWARPEGISFEKRIDARRMVSAAARGAWGKAAVSSNL